MSVKCPGCGLSFELPMKLTSKTRLKIRILAEVLASNEFDISKRGGLDDVMRAAAATVGGFYSEMQGARQWLISRAILFHPHDDRFEWAVNEKRMGILESLLEVSPRYTE